MKLSKLSGLRFPFGVRGAVASFIMVGLAGAGITAYTGAVFTDSATSSANTFTAGTLNLQLNGNESETAQMAVPVMAPGDGTVYKVIVHNDGSLALRYSLTLTPVTLAVTSISAADPALVTTTTDHGLATGDSVTISGAGAANGSYAITRVSATTFTVPFDNDPGSVINAGTVAGPALSAGLYPALKWMIMKTGGTSTCTAGADAESSSAKFALGNGSFTGLPNAGGTYTALPTTPFRAFGDPAEGADTDDRDLAAGASETLCIKVVLPLTTVGTPTSGYQAKAAAFDLQFDAEQTANNP